MFKPKDRVIQLKDGDIELFSRWKANYIEYYGKEPNMKFIGPTLTEFQDWIKDRKRDFNYQSAILLKEYHLWKDPMEFEVDRFDNFIISLPRLSNIDKENK